MRNLRKNRLLDRGISWCIVYPLRFLPFRKSKISDLKRTYLKKMLKERRKHFLTKISRITKKYEKTQEKSSIQDQIRNATKKRDAVDFYSSGAFFAMISLVNCILWLKGSVRCGDVPHGLRQYIRSRLYVRWRQFIKIITKGISAVRSSYGLYFPFINCCPYLLNRF